MAPRLSNDDYQHWVVAQDRCPKEHQFAHAFTGLAGECGEVIELYTKALRDFKVVSRTDLASELGDVIWFVTRIARLYDIELQDLIDGNVAKLTERT